MSSVLHVLAPPGDPLHKTYKRCLSLLRVVMATISLLKQVFMSFSVFFNASLAPTEDSYEYESRAAFTGRKGRPE